MQLYSLLRILILLLLGLLFLGIANFFQSSPLSSRLPKGVRRSPRQRLVHLFVVGTDNDLKIELAFLLYITITAYLTNWPYRRPRLAFEPFHAAIATLVGFHFRQWLSKWRLRNIVSLPRLTAPSLFVLKSSSAIDFILTNIFLISLLYLNPSYGLFSLFGLFLHEIFLEAKKNKLVLRRRLHLFDLADFQLDVSTARIIRTIATPFGPQRLQRLISSERDKRRNLALRAFRELIRNNQEEFYRLLDQELPFIQADTELCYYFGRALYTIGDIDRAEHILEAGHCKEGDAGCAAYLALVALARGPERERAQYARDLLKRFIEPGPPSPGKMFAHAYYALASIFLAEQGAVAASPLGSDALCNIHVAMQINEKYLADHKLGDLSYPYFRGNELILTDICGYIIFRLGEPRLAYRILEGAILADNTYPWPYFHIGLIYESAGQRNLARSLFTRIALNERTDSVIYRLSMARVNRLQ